jgi:hypothetical protein
MRIAKYKHAVIIKHALQYYINRPNAEFEKHIVSERNLLERVTEEVKEMKDRYRIK